MPFVFVDDGYPEANDYASNYEPVETAGTALRPAAAPAALATPHRPAWNALDCLVRFLAACRVPRLLPAGGGP